jgi:hypothetical protein
VEKSDRPLVFPQLALTDFPIPFAMHSGITREEGVISLHRHAARPMHCGRPVRETPALWMILAPNSEDDL